MIDIHTHILAGFDDGPRTFEESVLLVKQAAEGGTSILFATPHVSTSGDLENSHCIQAAVKLLQSAICEQGVGVTILPGAEVFPSLRMLDSLDVGRPITLGERRDHILLDMPLSVMPIELERLVFELKTRGITPILAHPERSLPIQNDPQLLEKAVHAGLLLQVNASSLLGDNGGTAADTALTLLRLRWVSLVASDAHSIRRRPSRMDKAREFLAGTHGNDIADELCLLNGQRIIRGDIIPTNPEAYVRKPAGGFAGTLLAFFRRKETGQ